MTSSLAQRAQLQLRAEQAFLQLDEAISEIERRRRRALRLSRWLVPAVAVLASGMLLKRMLHHPGARRRSRPLGVLEAHPMELAAAFLLRAALRAWTNRTNAVDPIYPQLGPRRPS